jgi:hypothetical protein
MKKDFATPAGPAKSEEAATGLASVLDQDLLGAQRFERILNKAFEGHPKDATPLVHWRNGLPRDSN